MVTEVNIDDMTVGSSRRALDSGKVGAVKESNAVQELPNDGKKLPPQAKSAEEVSEQLDEVANELNGHVQFVNRELQFSVDEESGHTVIKVMDAKTQEVIRQIPGEEALKFARMLNEGGDVELFSAYT